MRLRRLAKELRAARADVGLSAHEVAVELGWSQSKVSRLETARTYPAVEDVSAMLERYDIEPAKRSELLGLASGAHKRGWWSIYGDVFTGSYMDMEDEAVQIRSYQIQLIPGLLQIPPYTRAVLNATLPDLAEEGVEQRVRARMARKALLTRARPPELSVLLDEGVFRRMAGDPDMLTAQIQALRETPDNVTVQILRDNVGFHQGIEGSFVIMSFEEELSSDIVFIEGTAGEAYVENASRVDRCKIVFDRLRARALSSEQSIAWMTALAKESS